MHCQGANREPVLPLNQIIKVAPTFILQASIKIWAIFQQLAAERIGIARAAKYRLFTLMLLTVVRLQISQMFPFLYS